VSKWVSVCGVVSKRSLARLAGTRSKLEVKEFKLEVKEMKKVITCGVSEWVSLKLLVKEIKKVITCRVSKWVAVDGVVCQRRFTRLAGTCSKLVVKQFKLEVKEIKKVTTCRVLEGSPSTV